MSKEWTIKRNQLTREPIFNKLHNPEKISELDEQLEQVCSQSNNHDLIQKLCRKIIEEVVNVMQHNAYWSEISVQSKYNQDGDNVRIRIQYDGGKVFDPEQFNLANVVGPSVNKFREYKRLEPEINQEIVTLRIHVKI